MTLGLDTLKNLRERPADLFLAAFAIVGIAYQLPKVLAIEGSGAFALDFRMIWLAGKIWAAGLNPYGPAFQEEYLKVFDPGINMYWVYPPYWYPLAVPFGLLPFSLSNLLWKLFNFSLLLLGCHLVARAAADVLQRRYAPIFLIGVGYACLMQATASTIAIGQTPILVFFGFAATAYGLLKERPAMLVVGLVFVALKPNIGAIVFIAVAVLPHYRWAVLSAGLLCLLATAPILLGGEYIATIQGFLTGLRRYPSETPASNGPQNLTGIIHITDYLFSATMSVFHSTLALIVATVMIVATGFHFLLGGRPGGEYPRRAIVAVVLLISTVGFFVPLHAYDVVFLAIVLMLAYAVPIPGRWLLAPALVMAMRPLNFANVIGIVHPASQGFPESLFLSLALLMVFLAALWAFAQALTRATEARLA